MVLRGLVGGARGRLYIQVEVYVLRRECVQAPVYVPGWRGMTRGVGLCAAGVELYVGGGQACREKVAICMVVAVLITMVREGGWALGVVVEVSRKQSPNVRLMCDCDVKWQCSYDWQHWSNAGWVSERGNWNNAGWGCGGHWNNVGCGFWGYLKNAGWGYGGYLTTLARMLVGGH